MQGTPALIPSDRAGGLRKQCSGFEDEVRVGAGIASEIADRRLSDDA